MRRAGANMEEEGIVGLGLRRRTSWRERGSRSGGGARNADDSDLILRKTNKGCAHMMGMARCSTFSSRLQQGSKGSDINLDFLQNLQQLCSDSDSNSRLAQLDLVSPATFDNQYYINLLSGEGLLPSDQALVTKDYQTRQLVLLYAQDPLAFFQDFKISMLKMGSLGPLTGNDGEICTNCRFIN
ncbi:Heme peroxidase, plant/fungal/bacterial [Corchorus olitorius]|uniref:peroxidase n=1 Tax=Corchorus olitorius TaxID=93759 RepID=A0A1R3HF80_9ROSI|nr:Heme peroxidase, plant/fungal/bacterial [Corchorus olitorius]